MQHIHSKSIPNHTLIILVTVFLMMAASPSLSFGSHSTETVPILPTDFDPSGIQFSKTLIQRDAVVQSPTEEPAIIGQQSGPEPDQILPTLALKLTSLTRIEDERMKAIRDRGLAKRFRKIRSKIKNQFWKSRKVLYEKDKGDGDNKKQKNFGRSPPAYGQITSSNNQSKAAGRNVLGTISQNEIDNNEKSSSSFHQDSYTSSFQSQSHLVQPQNINFVPIQNFIPPGPYQPTPPPNIISPNQYGNNRGVSSSSEQLPQPYRLQGINSAAFVGSAPFPHQQREIHPPSNEPPRVAAAQQLRPTAVSPRLSGSEHLRAASNYGRQQEQHQLARPPGIQPPTNPHSSAAIDYQHQGPASPPSYHPPVGYNPYDQPLNSAINVRKEIAQGNNNRGYGREVTAASGIGSLSGNSRASNTDNYSLQAGKAKAAKFKQGNGRPEQQQMVTSTFRLSNPFDPYRLGSRIPFSPTSVQYLQIPAFRFALRSAIDEAIREIRRGGDVAKVMDRVTEDRLLQIPQPDQLVISRPTVPKRRPLFNDNLSQPQSEKVQVSWNDPPSRPLTDVTKTPATPTKFAVEVKSSRRQSSKPEKLAAKQKPKSFETPHKTMLNQKERKQRKPGFRKPLIKNVGKTIEKKKPPLVTKARKSALKAKILEKFSKKQKKKNKNRTEVDGWRAKNTGRHRPSDKKNLEIHQNKNKTDKKRNQKSSKFAPVQPKVRRFRKTKSAPVPGGPNGRTERKASLKTSLSSRKQSRRKNEHKLRARSDGSPRRQRPKKFQRTVWHNWARQNRRFWPVVGGHQQDQTRLGFSLLSDAAAGAGAAAAYPLQIFHPPQLPIIQSREKEISTGSSSKSKKSTKLHESEESKNDESDQSDHRTLTENRIKLPKRREGSGNDQRPPTEFIAPIMTVRKFKPKKKMKPKLHETAAVVLNENEKRKRRKHRRLSRVEQFLMSFRRFQYHHKRRRNRPNLSSLKKQKKTGK